MIVSFEKAGKVFAVDVEKLPAESVAYLLQYGWNQSLQDCIAGRAKAVKDEYEEKCKKDGEEVDSDELAEAIKSDILGNLSKRFDAILAGNVGVRAGRPRDELRAIAQEMVKRALVKAGKKATKEKFTELVDNLLTEKRDIVQAELDRRKAAEVEVEV